MQTFALALALLAQSASSTCPSEYTQSNPIYNEYPTTPSGVLNGTVAVIPIPYKTARDIVPAQYPILTRAYQQLMPELNGMYPALLELELDHDVRSGDIKIPDFQRAAVYFPFVDRLNDGYTSMSYGNAILQTVNLVANGGTLLYGYEILPATFEPCGQAYASEAGSSTTYFNATGLLGNGSIDSVFSPLMSSEQIPWSLDVIKNLTGQPQFSNDPLFCDNFVRLYNTSLTEPPYAPVAVKGTVVVGAPALPKSATFSNVYGYNMATPFLEYNYEQCSTLKGQ